MVLGRGRGGVGGHLLGPRRRGRGRAGRPRRRADAGARGRRTCAHAAFRLAGVDWAEDEELLDDRPGPTGCPTWRSVSIKNDGYSLLRCGRSGRGRRRGQRRHRSRGRRPGLGRDGSTAPAGGSRTRSAGATSGGPRSGRSSPPSSARLRPTALTEALLDALRLRRRRVAAARLHPTAPGPAGARRARRGARRPARRGAGDAVAQWHRCGTRRPSPGSPGGRGADGSGGPTPVPVRARRVAAHLGAPGVPRRADRGPRARARRGRRRRPAPRPRWPARSSTLSPRAARARPGGPRPGPAAHAHPVEFLLT